MAREMSSPRENRTGRQGYAPPRKVCQFCANKVSHIDYKDTEKLRTLISDRGKIDPRRRTGTCARHQRILATAIKRARHLALLPIVPMHIRKTGVFGAMSIQVRPQPQAPAPAPAAGPAPSPAQPAAE